MESTALVKLCRESHASYLSSAQFCCSYAFNTKKSWYTYLLEDVVFISSSQYQHISQSADNFCHFSTLNCKFLCKEEIKISGGVHVKETTLKGHYAPRFNSRGCILNTPIIMVQS